MEWLLSTEIWASLITLTVLEIVLGIDNIVILAIISNTDDAIVAGNVARIGVAFDHVITAEQVGAYKPSPVIFAYALRVLGCGPHEVLHVAQGFEYDVVAAHDLGWNRVWINRYGKTGDPTFGPYVELPDLGGLPGLLGL